MAATSSQISTVFLPTCGDYQYNVVDVVRNGAAMGNYLNPGNAGFTEIRNAEYVDKSGLIELVNRTIRTPQKLSCMSRPRRFGKSFAAKMLCAYYDRSCDSHDLFDDLAIAQSPTYKTHLNKYDVLYVDMTAVIGEVGIGGLINHIKNRITEELLQAYPHLKTDPGIMSTLANAVETSGTQFFMIVDEWDAPIREASHDATFQREYLEFLRLLFKNSAQIPKVFSGAYMTGILPIKKDHSQSAVSEFKEYTMVDPLDFAPFIGFLEDEVRRLCERRGGGFERMRDWYDGYRFPGVDSVYNPNSVMQALRRKVYRSYWAGTSAANNLLEYIRLDYAGLSRTVAELLGGVEVPVDVDGFSNDLVTFRNKDDVLTLLVHLGYLAYDPERETARIPNEEIRREFQRSIKEVDRTETVARVAASAKLVEDTVHGDEKAVAEGIERVHAEWPSLYYNTEQALRSTIKLAYFCYADHYLHFEELPAGAGVADIVYLPKRDSPYPALVIELKWDISAKGAIDQIRDRDYPRALDGFDGEVLLVGISYDKRAEPGHRTHTCKIEVA
jgi:hypothetical protein